MTRDDVIRLAREAGWRVPYPEETGCEDCGIDLERFAALVAAAEREACAREVEAERIGFRHDDEQLNRIAAAIRARGEKGGVTSQRADVYESNHGVGVIVPSELEPKLFGKHSAQYVNGWNDCRATMLNIAQKGGV